jgi:hypothetical protein
LCLQPKIKSKHHYLERMKMKNKNR